MNAVRTVVSLLLLALLGPAVLLAGLQLGGGGETPLATPRVTAGPVVAEPVVTPWWVPSPAPTRASRGTVRVPAPTLTGSASVHPPAARVVRVPARAAGQGIPAVWRSLVACESPDRGWRYGAPDVGIDAGYRYMGGPNFTAATWRAYKPASYPANAWDATPAQQILVAKRVLADQGISAWPRCGPRVGLSMEDAR